MCIRDRHYDTVTVGTKSKCNEIHQQIAIVHDKNWKSNSKVQKSSQIFGNSCPFITQLIIVKVNFNDVKSKLILTYELTQCVNEKLQTSNFAISAMSQQRFTNLKN